jgi:hypothetical protein
VKTRKTSDRKLSHVEIYNQPDCILPKSFFEGRFVPNLNQESLDYIQWWEEQERRCKEGWSDGGYHMSGLNYYHLNFKKINMIDIKTNAVIVEHPYFSFEDQQLFSDIDQARKNNNEGIMLITGRGFGKSFSVASVVEYEFTFADVSECIVSSSIERYASLLWEKVEMGLNSQPQEFRRSLLKDTSTLKQSGYTIRDEGTNQFVKVDSNSFIRKVIYDSDAGKTRGTRPNIHIFEEVGSWTGAASLIECFKKTEPSWWRGSIKMTFPIFIGTGGEMDSGGSIDAKMIFNNPVEYGLKAYEYEERKIGKFYPAYAKFTGYYEKSGASDKEGAKAFLDARREKKKANPELYRQESSEFPYNPDEAFQVSGHGVFPVDILEKRYADIERSPAIKNMVQRGNLEWERDGSKIIGVRWEVNPEGAFEILEHPAWTKSGWSHGKIANLYVSGCDSFDAVAEDDRKISETERKGKKSRGSNFIYKRFFNASETSRVFVAKITQRTDDATEFYWNTVKLNMYYNSKILVEYTKTGILQHYITNGFEYMLHRRPRLDSTVVKESLTTNRYGLSMPVEIKRHVIARLVAYVRTDSDQIFFTSLIRDMLGFTFEGRDKNQYDETMAAAITIIADDDMFKIAAKSAQASSFHFPKFVRDSRGNLVFN